MGTVWKRAVLLEGRHALFQEGSAITQGFLIPAVDSYISWNKKVIQYFRYRSGLFLMQEMVGLRFDNPDVIETLINMVQVFANNNHILVPVYIERGHGKFRSRKFVPALPILSHGAVVESPCGRGVLDGIAPDILGQGLFGNFSFPSGPSKEIANPHIFVAWNQGFGQAAAAAGNIDTTSERTRQPA